MFRWVEIQQGDGGERSIATTKGGTALDYNADVWAHAARAANLRAQHHFSVGRQQPFHIAGFER